MRTITVKGEPYLVSHLAAGEVAPGLLVTGIRHRKAMRVVCLDGDDVILRNLRHPDMLEAESIERMLQFYERIVPAAKGVEAKAPLKKLTWVKASSLNPKPRKMGRPDDAWWL